MHLALIIIGSIIVYALIGVWTFGYVCGAASKKGGYSTPESYYDEPNAWFGAIFWPIYLLFKIVIGQYLISIMHLGTSIAIRQFEQKKLRIETEAKFRLEQKAIEEKREVEIQREHERLEEEMKREQVEKYRALCG